MKIVRAQMQHADDVARLFDLYRQFYEQPTNLKLAQEFISNRNRQ